PLLNLKTANLHFGADKINEVKTYDDDIIPQIESAILHKKRVEINLPIRNIHRTVGARMSGLIVGKYGAKGLPDDMIKINFTGSAGQSFGAFLAPGISLRIEGDANDYLGKGMSGGRIILLPPTDAGFQAHENVICGNVILYGATGGEVYINGRAGERFAVRNSGALTVVEGVGDHACEYMTGGTVVVIGPTGENFGAGMSGGVAYIYDYTQLFDTRCNLDMVDLESVWNKEDVLFLHSILQKHYNYTGSSYAAQILSKWDSNFPMFVKVMPIDYRKSLERMKQTERTDLEIVAATEEVFNV
ncbi:MAG: glutamate synthase subunit alpha, partial [Candidatus Marinimicrobia bacterium]|nr:glutamate synthase subunit alpha [Candidatus Neomarinimicrobiota bacterium]